MLVFETDGPITELQSVLKSLTREELEAYALLNSVGYATLCHQVSPDGITFHFKSIQIQGVLELAGKVSLEVSDRVKTLIEQRN